jgi:hypothetical protein
VLDQHVDVFDSPAIRRLGAVLAAVAAETFAFATATAISSLTVAAVSFTASLMRAVAALARGLPRKRDAGDANRFALDAKAIASLGSLTDRRIAGFSAARAVSQAAAFAVVSFDGAATAIAGAGDRGSCGCGGHRQGQTKN